MCRNIKLLFNFDPPASQEEIRASALQYVRKVSGFRQPPKLNEVAFEQAVEDISQITSRLLTSLITQAAPKNREIEAEKMKARSRKRFA